jgi:hypothetical protein
MTNSGSRWFCFDVLVGSFRDRVHDDDDHRPERFKLASYMYAQSTRQTEVLDKVLRVGLVLLLHPRHIRIANLFAVLASDLVELLDAGKLGKLRQLECAKILLEAHGSLFIDRVSVRFLAAALEVAMGILSDICVGR